MNSKHDGSTYSSRFTLGYPPTIRFGWGSFAALGELLADVAESSMPYHLVTSPSFVRAGIPERLAAALGEASAGVFADVEHDPSLETVDWLIEDLRSSQSCCVVAVGGGSVLDVAKAAAVLAPIPDASVRPFFVGERAISKPGLPLIAVPTTAGSGAEVTRNAVLTDRESRIKQSLRSPLMTPRMAVVDPELTLSMPSELTASTGLDALTQAVESFISRRAHDVSAALAIRAVGLIMGALKHAVADGTDRAAREAMASGSLLSAMAFSQSGLGAAHGLSHPLGTVLGLPHGYVCAVLLPHVLEWNLRSSQSRLDDLGRHCGAGDASGFVEAVRRLCRAVGIPEGFTGAGLARRHFDFIVDNCRSGSMQANPRPMSDADVVSLLERVSG